MFGIYSMLFVCTLLTISTTSSSEYNGTLLQKRLFTDYNINVRPVSNYYSPVVVTVGLALRKVLDLDEIHQSFKTTVNILLYWKDELLVWNETVYNGISSIEFPFNKNIWIPDLMNYNALMKPGQLGIKGAFVRVFRNGQVFLWTQTNLNTACEIKTKKYPFDEQTCKILFAKFISSDEKVIIKPLGDGIDMADYVEIADWDIIKHQATSIVSPYNISTDILDDASAVETLNYTVIEYTLHMKRSCRLCFHNVIIPVFVLAFLNLMSFFVPCESGGKTSYPISIFLTLAVFLTVITQSLPESVDGVSYLSSYVTFQLSISAITLFSAVISLQLHYKIGQIKDPKHLPFLVRFFKCGKTAQRTEEENCFELQQQNAQDDSVKVVKDKEFIDVSYAFDKLMFAILLLCEVITTVIYIELILN